MYEMCFYCVFVMFINLSSILLDCSHLYTLSYITAMVLVRMHYSYEFNNSNILIARQTEIRVKRKDCGCVFVFLLFFAGL